MKIFISGPIVSVIANKFGHRAVVILGGLLSGGGLFVSTFSNSLAFLYMTYGVLGGKTIYVNTTKTNFPLVYTFESLQKHQGIYICRFP